MRRRQQIKMAKVYDNETLDQTWKRVSRHAWEVRHQFRDPRIRRLEAVRARRWDTARAELCDCDD